MTIEEAYEWLLENFPQHIIEKNVKINDDSVIFNGYKITVKKDEGTVVGKGVTIKDAIRDVIKLSKVIGLWHP